MRRCWCPFRLIFNDRHRQIQFTENYDNFLLDPCVVGHFLNNKISRFRFLSAARLKASKPSLIVWSTDGSQLRTSNLDGQNASLRNCLNVSSSLFIHFRVKSWRIISGSCYAKLTGAFHCCALQLREIRAVRHCRPIKKASKWQKLNFVPCLSAKQSWI